MLYKAYALRYLFALTFGFEFYPGEGWNRGSYVEEREGSSYPTPLCFCVTRSNSRGHLEASYYSLVIVYSSTRIAPLLHVADPFEEVLLTRPLFFVSKGVQNLMPRSINFRMVEIP